MHDAKMIRIFIFFHFDIIHAFLSQLLTTKCNDKKCDTNSIETLEINP